MDAKTRNRANVRQGDAEQAVLVQWARLKQVKWPELVLLFAIPNGGYLAGNIGQRAAQAARLKAGGMCKGVPDFCLPVARGGFHGLYIELKSGKGRATPDQKWWIEALKEQGYRAEVCQGWQAGTAVITEYMEE